MNGVSKGVILFFLCLGFFSGVMAQASTDAAEIQAKRLFRRLTGTPIGAQDPRLSQMVELIRSGRALQAAAIATAFARQMWIGLRMW